MSIIGSTPILSSNPLPSIPGFCYDLPESERTTYCRKAQSVAGGRIWINKDEVKNLWKKD